MCGICVQKMICKSTRQSSKGTVRRYACLCGRRETTLELIMNSRGAGKPITNPNKQTVLDAVDALENAIQQLKRNIT